MASINSIMGGAGASGGIYGNKNIISGLASGMDTESMIENAVSGYKLKISMLQQQRTMVEWKQSSYRSIINKLAAFTEKYTSFSSSSNLSRAHFFDSAIKVSTEGANADKIAASGRTDSDIQIDSVANLATKTRYSVESGRFILGAGSSDSQNVRQADGSFDINGTVQTGTLEGSLTLGYGGKKVRVSFSQKDVFSDAQQMADAINKQLSEQEIAFDGGTSAKASERIKAVVKNGGIEFETVKSGDDNGVWIDAADSGLEKALGIQTAGEERDLKGFQFPADTVKDEKIIDVLSQKGFTVTIDGVTKTIKAPTSQDMGGTITEQAYLEKLNANIADAFGADKLTVSNAITDGSGMVQLQFTAAKDTEFAVSASAGKQLGMEKDVTSFVNLERSIGDVLKTVSQQEWDSWRIAAKGTVKASEDGKTFRDEDDNLVAAGADGKYYRVNEQGETLYDLKVNGKSAGQFTKNATVNSVMEEISANKELGIKASYSRFSDKFTFAATETGAGRDIHFDENGLGAALFGGGQKQAGQDATVTVTVNGEQKTIHRASNNFKIDGLNITLKGEFAEGVDPVTFRSESDADKIIGAIRDMVKDYNDMAKEIREAYTTMPETDSKGNPYKPLTDKDREDMSENEIKNFEERAKKGILFADRDLNNLYNGLRDSLSALGIRGNDAKELGITTSFENGATTIALDETQLRKALEQDPDKVRDVFVSSRKNGDKTDGIMVGLKEQMERFGKTTGASKGILVNKAGSPLAPTSVLQNEMQKEIQSFDRQIETWQEKLADKIDYYNSRFTALETLIAEMNNQSGMLMGLSGGGF